MRDSDISSIQVVRSSHGVEVSNRNPYPLEEEESSLWSYSGDRPGRLDDLDYVTIVSDERVIARGSDGVEGLETAYAILNPLATLFSE